MNEIIKNIEAAQLKQTVPVSTLEILLKYLTRSKREAVKESRFSKEPLLRDRTAAPEKHLP